MTMKRLPDTVFTRLFGLVLAALLTSQLLTAALFLLFAPPRRPPPPPPALAMTAPPPAAQPALPGPPPLPQSELCTLQSPPHGRPPLPLAFWMAQLIQLSVVTLLTWYGARRLTRPIEQLSQAAVRLGDNLQAPPLAETGPSETRQAARWFNHMQDRLRQQMAARTRFLAAVSHDLRTPLTRIRLRATQLPEGELQDKLIRDTDEMAAMLDATLGYLRDDTQKEAWQWLDVGALLQALAEDAREDGHDVNLTLSPNDPLYTLPASLRRCLANLLENAQRYGGDKVDIQLEQQPAWLRIDIRDHGPGIPENRMESVFEPFVRLEGSRSRHSGGVGLGLTIARDASRRLGATLELINAPGGGLIARLQLPRQAPMYPS